MINIELIRNSKLYEVNKYFETLEGTDLTKKDRLILHVAMIQRGGGIILSNCADENQSILLSKATRIQFELHADLQHGDDAAVYSEILMDKFHYAKCAIAEYFLENYSNLDRHEMIDKLFEINRKEQFFKVLHEQPNRYLQPDLCYSIILSSLIAQFYVMLEDLDNAVSSIMNAAYFYGASIERNTLPSDERIKQFIHDDINKRTQKANEARWQGHVEQQRRKYLELDKQRQSELGKDLTIKSVATWIYERHNQDDLEYETIRDHLSKARRGIFTND
ncbi:MAG: hypothetical protein L0G63_07780 [Psychrobacter sp.]|uniref:hypothetical protein n=1 Tax=Psychrobacter sp. TaxID=56811 RepID=UPI002649F43B|nr:hypothetical protein [Psychrobacter sp.]MDN5620360.1 hypothetical protein [Psychrobacter sp.]